MRLKMRILWHVLACVTGTSATVMMPSWMTPARAQAQTASHPLGILPDLVDRRWVAKNDDIRTQRLSIILKDDQYELKVGETAYKIPVNILSEEVALRSPYIFEAGKSGFILTDRKHKKGEVYVLIDDARVLHFIYVWKGAAMTYVQYVEATATSPDGPPFTSKYVHWDRDKAARAIYSSLGVSSDGLRSHVVTYGQRAQAPDAGQLLPARAQVIASAAPTVASAPVVPSTAAVHSGVRLALVIGNSSYTGTLGALSNPARDAAMVARTLQSAGFTVILVTDADQRTMKRAISSFGQQLSGAGKQATGLFFYAGHGVQSRGINYLVPVNAAIETEADVDLEAVAADTVLRQMEEAGASTSIVILDACRNLPLQRSFRDGSRGLARMEAPNGSFVAYSTAPGSVAADGTGANSPFAAALVAEMARPDQPIEVTFRNVRRQVIAATGGKQTPWDSSSLVDSFVFTPGR